MKLQEFSKNSSENETGPSYGKKFVCSDNLGQNIWHKVKRYKEIGQDFKDIMHNFGCFFDNYCQRLISGRKTGN